MSEIFEPALTQDMIDYMKIKATYDPARLDGIDVSLAQIASNVKSLGAKGDGISDDTTVLQNIINNAPTGSIIFFPLGTYLCGQLTIPNTKTLTFIGEDRNGSILKRTSATSNYPVLSVNGNGNNTLSVKHLTIDGGGFRTTGLNITNIDRFYIDDIFVKNCGIPGYASGHNWSVQGIFIQYVNYGTVINSSFDTIECDGILAFPCLRLLVRNNRMTNCGRFAAVNQQDQGNTVSPIYTAIEDNYAYNCGNGGFDVETDVSLPVTYARFAGNEVVNCGKDSWGYAWGISGGVYSTGVISGNKIVNFGTSNTDPGIYAYSTSEYIIEANEVLNGVGIGIDTNSGKRIISNNLSKGNYQGMLVTSCNNSTITHNIIDSNNNYGVKIYGSNNCVISNNEITNNGLSGNATGLIITSNVSGGSIIGNVINGTHHTDGIDFDTEAMMKSFEITGNIIQQFVTYAINISYGNTIASVLKGHKMSYGSAIPSTGWWSVGDIVYNTAPVASGIMGWVCVTAGVPGTWKTFGTIGA